MGTDGPTMASAPVLGRKVSLGAPMEKPSDSTLRETPVITPEEPTPSKQVAAPHDPVLSFVDASADLLSWRDQRRSWGALGVVCTMFYYAAFKGYGLMALVAYSLLIRVVYVTCHRLLFFSPEEKKEQEENGSHNPYALSNTIVAWRSVETLEDYAISLRVVLMLWAVAFLGRMVSDAQLVFGFVLFIFGKSIRWRKKDAMSLSDVDEGSMPVRLRRGSWQDAIRLVTVHERTKKHLLKLPSKATSAAAIFGGCYVWAVVITPVDLAILALVCWLGFGTLQRQEKTALIWDLYQNTKGATVFAYNTFKWLQTEVAPKTRAVSSTESAEESEGKAEAKVESKPEASGSRSVKARSSMKIEHYANRNTRSPERSAAGDDGPSPTPSVDEILKQHGLKPTLDGYQEASAMRHELTRSDIAKYGYWLTPKGQKRVEASTMPKYF